LSRPTRRLACGRCLRAACVCGCLAQPGVPVACPVSLLVLQHPREQREPKGTARLLHLALAGSRLLVGEDWSAAPPDPVAATGRPRRDVLLYPATPDDAALPAPPPLDPGWLEQPETLRLVVIDGTWRKSRLMLYRSPWLQGLPRFSLGAPPPSRYAVRRARGVGQRSTFEAALLALQALSPEPGPLDALWPVFDGFVAALQREASRRSPTIATAPAPLPAL
jgi:DTW domain-containing protein YfiP